MGWMLGGCWSSIAHPYRHLELPRRAAPLPAVQILADSGPQRLAFCQVFRESQQFEDVRCGDVPDPRIAATLHLRIETTLWSNRVAEQVGYGGATLGTCVFWYGGRARQTHHATLSFRGHEDRFNASGEGATQRYTCLFPTFYMLMFHSMLWGPAAGSSYASWPALESACGDPYYTGDRVATEGGTERGIGRGTGRGDRKACEMIRRIVTESASESAAAMLPTVVRLLAAPAAPPPAPPVIAPAAPPSPPAPPVVTPRPRGRQGRPRSRVCSAAQQASYRPSIASATMLSSANTQTPCQLVSHL